MHAGFARAITTLLTTSAEAAQREPNARRAVPDAAARQLGRPPLAGAVRSPTPGWRGSTGRSAGGCSFCPCWWSAALAADAARPALSRPVAPRPVPGRRRRHARRRLHLQRHRRPRHRRAGRAHPLAADPERPGERRARRRSSSLAQALVGLLVLVQFNRFAILLGVASLATVAIYPFLKRVTDWPQLGLGIAFSWGALMGWAAAIGQPRRWRRSSSISAASPGRSATTRSTPTRTRRTTRWSASARPRGCSARRPNRISPASTRSRRLSSPRPSPLRAPARSPSSAWRLGAVQLAWQVTTLRHRRRGQLPPPLSLEPRLRPDPVRRDSSPMPG